MRGFVAIALLAALLAACGTDETSAVTDAPAATEAEMTEFCERYSEVRNMGRREMMRALLDVAPADFRDVFERESQRGGGGPDDTVLVDGLLNECDRRLSE